MAQMTQVPPVSHRPLRTSFETPEGETHLASKKHPESGNGVQDKVRLSPETPDSLLHMCRQEAAPSSVTGCARVGCHGKGTTSELL